MASDKTELSAIRSHFKAAISATFMLSAAINILAISSSIYLLLIYDRVLSSQSAETLLSLIIIFSFAFLFHGAFDVLRTLLFNGIGRNFEAKLDARVQKLHLDNSAKGQEASKDNPIRDLEQLRSFLSSNGPSSIMDLPWTLLFIAILSLMHIWLGIVTIIGVIILAVIAYATERFSFDRVSQLRGLHHRKNTLIDRNIQHAGTISTMGMKHAMLSQSLAAGEKYRHANSELSRMTGILGGTSRIFRIFLQSAVLTVGAWLVINGSATAGIIFASSILAGRALAPVDQAIANWRNIVQTRQAWDRLNITLAEHPEDEALQVQPPLPEDNITLDHVVATPPNSQRVAISDISLEAKRGELITIIGASGSGKSSLSRVIAGLWPAARGSVRLDGATFDQWDRDSLGKKIGYLPQEVDLFGGVISHIIARGDASATSDQIIEAAKMAGVHDMILQLPDGYETDIGAQAQMLSGGQRQRLALARALFGKPFLIILDEPNSNLDPEGEAALTKAIKACRDYGAIVFLVTHHPALLKISDKILVMANGSIRMWGPRDDVLEKLKAGSAGANKTKTAKGKNSITGGGVGHSVISGQTKK